MSLDNTNAIVKKKAISQKRFKPRNVSLKDIQGLIGAEATGEYNQETYAKIIAFQKKLFPRQRRQWDGIFGKNTLRAYNSLYNNNRAIAQ